jgi:hypothetical protein
MNAVSGRKLALDDIADLRAYERERAEFRARVIELKQRRRIGVGPFVTVVFENRDTIRFQIQEMARVEKLISDEAILHEIETYNPLIPEPGELAATMFIELTSKLALMDWLPRLVGIERAVRLRLADGTEIAAEPDAGHDAQLTDTEVTSSVHYIHWRLTSDQIEAFARGGVSLVIAHPEYDHAAVLPTATVEELLTDLR